MRLDRADMAACYRLLVFDWDGTLADSEATIVDAMQQAIYITGMPEIPVAAIRETIGLGLPAALRQLYPQAGMAQLTQLAQTYSQAWLAATAAPIPLFADAETTLMQLCESGYLLAVATGKSRRGLDRALRAAGLERVFSGSRTADETVSKPHPAMLEELLQEFDLPASAALMIGDSEYDVQMAMAAGVDAVGVDSGVHSPGRLLECGAISCLDSIARLPAWLGSRGTSEQYYANSR